MISLSLIITALLYYTSPTSGQCTTSSDTFCYDIDVSPPSCGGGGGVSESVKVTSTASGIWQYHKIAINNIGTGDCVSPTIDVRYEEIDYDQPYEYVQFRGENNYVFLTCQGTTQYACGQFGTCATDQPITTCNIESGDSYTITLEATDDVHALCPPYSLNVTVTVTCDDPCAVPCTPAPTIPCTPTPTNFCYDGEVLPGCSGEASESVKVTSEVSGAEQYHEILFYNNGEGDCINPSIDVRYEEIDYDSPYEYVNINAQDGSLIQTCQGTAQFACGVYGTCLTDEPLPDVTSIDAGDSYRVTVYATDAVHALCPPYSLNVTVTLNCEGYCECTDEGYVYVGRASSINNAKALCQSKGLTLATVPGAKMEAYKAAVEAVGVPYTGYFGYTENGNTAIGLGDEANEGDFLWDDGTACDVTGGNCISYWRTGQPSNWAGSEHCATLAFTGSAANTGYGNDAGCDVTVWDPVGGLYVFCNDDCLPCPTDVDFIYVQTPLSYQEAKKYCRRVYGTTLATISTDAERQAAIDLIGDETVWFGLYSRGTGGNWKFLNGDECPADSVFKCIDFWKYRLNGDTNYRPRCIGPSEGGYQCGNFDGDEDIADNDIDCEDALPFLCDSCKV